MEQQNLEMQAAAAELQPAPEAQQPRTRADISRDNGRRSQGPRTPEGIAASKYNATKHGLCAQTLVLPDDDRAVFTQFHRNLAADLRVHGELEQSLALNIASAQYQIERARAIENNILQIGAMDLPELHPDPAIDQAKRLAQSFEKNAKHLDLISRYTARHTRELLQTHARLREVQKERLAFHQQRKARHSQDLQHHQQNAVQGKSNQHPAPNPGFVRQTASEPPHQPAANPETGPKQAEKSMIEAEKIAA